MEDRLTAHKTVVDPDIPAFDRRVFGFKNLFLRVNQQINRVTLFLSEAEIVRDVAFRDKKRVPRRHRESVTDGVRVVILFHDPLPVVCLNRAEEAAFSRSRIAAFFF